MNKYVQNYFTSDFDLEHNRKFSLKIIHLYKNLIKKKTHKNRSSIIYTFVILNSIEKVGRRDVKQKKSNSSLVDIDSSLNLAYFCHIKNLYFQYW